MKDHVVVCGAGSTGRNVIEELLTTGIPVIAVDLREGELRELADKFPKAEFSYIVGDATDDDVMAQTGLERARGLVAALSSDKDNLYLTVSGRQANPGTRIVARCAELSHVEKIRKSGADAVVSPNFIGGMRLVSELLRPAVVRFLDDMLRDRRAAYRIEEIRLGDSRRRARQDAARCARARAVRHDGARRTGQRQPVVGLQPRRGRAARPRDDAGRAGLGRAGRRASPGRGVACRPLPSHRHPEAVRVGDASGGRVVAPRPNSSSGAAAMPIRDLVIAFVAAATACASNPDPRPRSIEFVQRDGHGGWIVVELRGGAELSGELISVETAGLQVLTLTPRLGLAFVPKANIVSATLWPWETEYGRPLVWGGLGAASTISHGFLLVLSAPIWVLTATITAGIESRASQLEYPGDGWDQFSIWARFPQGLPAGLTEGDVLRQNRAPPPPLPTGPPGGNVGPAGDVGPGVPPAPWAGRRRQPRARRRSWCRRRCRERRRSLSDRRRRGKASEFAERATCGKALRSAVALLRWRRRGIAAVVGRGCRWPREAQQFGEKASDRLDAGQVQRPPADPLVVLKGDLDRLAGPQDRSHRRDDGLLPAGRLLEVLEVFGRQLLWIDAGDIGLRSLP